MLTSELKKIPLFRNFPRTALTTLSRLVEVKTYDRGHTIFQEGKTRDRLFIVLQGRVIIEKEILGQNHDLAVFKPHDVLSETILYSPGGKHHHTGKSFTADTKLLEITVYNLLKLFKAHPNTSHLVHQYMIEVVSQRLARTNEKLLTLFATGKLAINFKNKHHLIESLLVNSLQLFNVRKAALVLFDTVGRRILVEHAVGYAGKRIPKVLLLDADTLISQILSQKKSIIVTPADWQKQYEGTFYGSKHMLITPIVTKREIIGAVLLADKINRRQFSLNNQILLEAIAEQIAPSLSEIEREAAERSSRQLHNIYIDPFYN